MTVRLWLSQEEERWIAERIVGFIVLSGVLGIRSCDAAGNPRRKGGNEGERKKER
jgi:hypothetical protein